MRCFSNYATDVVFTMTNLIKSDSGEMIFGTESSSSTEESRVMSEKVQTMASSIYKEFERMIQQFGEESVKVKQMEIQRHQEREWLHSNLVWICSSARGRSLVSVIRANKANEIIDTFDVSSSHILCVCSISGDDDDLDTTQTGISRRDWSHLIVWEVKCET
ncbi:JNK-interacting protein [Trichinella pseudospiralis]